MNKLASTLTIWEGGRLAPAPAPRRIEFGRDRWIAAALLLLCAIVLGLFVAVLVQDVDRSALRREELHTRALAAAQCEAQASVEARDGCLAQLDGGTTAVATGDDDAGPGDATQARATAVSLSAPANWRQ